MNSADDGRPRSRHRRWWGMTPARVQFGPQHAPRDGAHRCRRAGHVRLPPIDRWASGLVPGVGMHVAQPIPMLPEAATGHQARVQRPVPHHLWISGRRPRLPVWTTSLSPPAQMGRAEPGVAARKILKAATSSSRGSQHREHIHVRVHRRAQGRLRGRTDLPGTGRARCADRPRTYWAPLGGTVETGPVGHHDRRNPRRHLRTRRRRETPARIAVRRPEDVGAPAA